MKNKYTVFGTYNFSDCREITGEELYLINGGERVENSNEAVANAQVGDTVERKDGTVVTITQGDIDWAKEMSKYHQNGFGADELKFVCKDGREAVFTKDFSPDGSYVLYKDAQYKETYNYCNPTTNPIGHFFADMLPYYLTGNRNERNQ